MICFLRVVVSWFDVCSNSHVTDHLVNVAARKLAQVMVTRDINVNVSLQVNWQAPHSL